jgi:hypothetical protein
MGKLDFRLYRQTAGTRSATTDCIPRNPKIPKPVLFQIHEWSTNGPCEVVLADMIWLAFFFLLHPGE